MHPSVTMDVVDPVIALKNVLRARWLLLGYGFEEDYAMLLATNLHAHGLRVITDIAHIDWNLIPYEMFGLKFVDVEILSISKLGDDLIANQLVVNAQVRQSMLQPAACHNMIINGVPSNDNSRTSRQQKPDNVILAKRVEDAVVIGSTE